MTTDVADLAQRLEAAGTEAGKLVERARQVTGNHALELVVSWLNGQKPPRVVVARDDDGRPCRWHDFDDVQEALEWVNAMTVPSDKQILDFLETRYETGAFYIASDQNSTFRQRVSRWMERSAAPPVVVDSECTCDEQDGCY